MVGVGVGPGVGATDVVGLTEGVGLTDVVGVTGVVGLTEGVGLPDGMGLLRMAVLWRRGNRSPVRRKHKINGSFSSMAPRMRLSGRCLA